MKVGDIVKIRNSVGILEVKLTKELQLDDINKGFGDEMIINGKARLEFHKGNDETLVTLTERESTHMVLVFLDKWEDKRTCFYGEFSCEISDNCFETIYE